MKVLSLNHGFLKEVIVPEALVHVAHFSLPRKRVKTQWLNFDQIPTNLRGYPILFDARIISIQTDSTIPSSGIFHLRRQSDGASLTTVTMSNEKVKVMDGLNIQVSSGDYLQVYCESTLGVEYPAMSVVLVWL